MNVNGLSAAFAAIVVSSAPALAKDAQCFTTDDGSYPCWFETTDASGSFTITAPGYPKFEVVIESPGVAWVYGTFDGGNPVALPGPYLRSEADRACWVNGETEAQICAW